jgi:hypothetical protein
MGLLRTRGALRHLVHSQGEAPGGPELWLRQARRDNQPVVSLRCMSAGDRFEVTCEVYPVDRITVEPLRPGPYLFATMREAEEFTDEATLVLEYLGCEIVESAA